MANDENYYLFKTLTRDLGDERYLKKSDYKKYTLPIATHTTLGGIKVGSGLSIDSSTGVLTANVQAQNTLNATQLNAVNSGINSTKVAKYDGYDAEINSKQNRLNTNGSAIHINDEDSIYLSSAKTEMADIAVVNSQDLDGSGNFTGYITNTLGTFSALTVYAGKGITTDADRMAASVKNVFNVWINYWANANGFLAQETMDWSGFHFPQFINWEGWEIIYKNNDTILTTSNPNGIVFRLSSANVRADENENKSGKVSYQAEINLFDILESEYDTEQLRINAIADFLANETGDTVDDAKLYAKSAYLKIRLSFKYQYDAHDIIDIKLNSSLYVMPN